MNKRVLRKFAIPSSRPNPKNGIFCADQVKYVVRTAIKNIDHQRTLVLYIYAKESVLAGNHNPRWTMFQQKGGYITLCTDDKGTRWQQSMFENLGKDYFFRDKCSFYSQADERRVTRYCQSEKQKGFESLCLLQLDLLRKKQRENELKKQRRIIERMKPVGALPRDIKGFMHRETLPHYIFYDYAKGKAPKNAYCTACKHNVSVAEAKHNGEGICPHCKRKITFKSRGRRGYIVDRSTAQVIQRLGSNEMIIRFVKAYQAGTLSYMTDDVSMIFFTVDPEVKDHYYRAPRRSRQMFFYKDQTLFQSRLYPSDLSEQMDLYRSIVQKAIATCLGVPNRWVLKKKREDVNECCTSGEGSRQYPDYNYYGNLSMLKTAAAPSHFVIGGPSLCVCCGQAYHSGHLKCRCEDTVVCKDCGNTVPKQNARYIEGVYHCHACLHICGSCGEMIHGTMYPAYDRRGRLVEICEACYRASLEPCAACSVCSICRIIGNAFCHRTSVTAAEGGAR